MFKAHPQPSSSSPEVDPIPPSLRAILDLFAAELRGVAFPGVDAALLGQHADEVRARSRDVEQAQGVLDAALSALQESTAALAAVAARGLAYARIYAADDAALSARVVELDAGERPAASAIGSGPAPLRRRRRRASERPELPLGDVAVDESPDPADD